MSPQDARTKSSTIPADADPDSDAGVNEGGADVSGDVNKDEADTGRGIDMPDVEPIPEGGLPPAKPTKSDAAKGASR